MVYWLTGEKVPNPKITILPQFKTQAGGRHIETLTLWSTGHRQEEGLFTGTGEMISVVFFY